MLAGVDIDGATRGSRKVATAASDKLSWVRPESPVANTDDQVRYVPPHDGRDE